MKKNKICYILPVYDRKADTHLAYLYDFIERAGGELDISVIVERKSSDYRFKHVKHLKTLRLIGALRFFEELFHVFLLRKKGYRDVYVHYSYTGALAGWFVTALLGGRVFYWNCGMPWLYKRNAFREWIFRCILRTTILVTGTESVRDMYVREYGLNLEQTRIMHNWIDLEKEEIKKISQEHAREKCQLPKDKKIVLFVHHLSKRKGAHYLVPTYKALQDTDILFVVVGDGPYREELEREVSDAALEKRVLIKGSTPHSEVPNFIQAANVFFMPSDEEGFPHVLLEAMAYGVPYVATDVGGVRDISPEAEQEYIVDSREPEVFARKIKEILEGSFSEDVLRQHVKRFDMKYALEQFVGLFEK